MVPTAKAARSESSVIIDPIILPALMGLGDQDMVRALAEKLDQVVQQEGSGISDKKYIAILAGAKSLDLFDKPEKTPKEGASTLDATRHIVFLAWQYLEKLHALPEGSHLIVPDHVVDDPRLQELVAKKKFHVICTRGVLHTMREKINMADSTAFEKAAPDVVVMVAGDVQDEKGAWQCYTPADHTRFLKVLHEQYPDKKITFIHGPRTGKYLLDEKTGDLVLREGVAPNPITLACEDFKKANALDTLWRIHPFIPGKPSDWPAVLKYMQENPDKALWVPDASTSMLSEALSVPKVQPVVYPNPRATAASKKFVATLEAGAVTFFELPATPASPKLSWERKPREPGFDWKADLVLVVARTLWKQIASTMSCAPEAPMPESAGFAPKLGRPKLG